MKRTIQTIGLIGILLGAWAGVSLLAQTANVAPVARQQVFDNNGNPLASAKLYTYASGTTTPQTTYSNAALSTPNANPIIADSSGRFGAIFLSATAYRFELQTSAGTVIYTQDNVSSVATGADIATINTTLATLGSVDLSLAQGRCSLTSGTPVTTADVTAATTIYWTPYGGNQITLRSSGGTWSVLSFTELSLALGADAASTVYDLYVYNNNGTAALERLAWTNATTRSTALTTQNGVLVKSGDATRRYVCTYRTTTVVGQTEDSFTKRFVWNYYNRVNRAMRRLETASSWLYTTNTWRQANGSTSNQIEFVVGVAEVPLSAKVKAFASNGTTTQVAAVSIGVDMTTTPATGALGMDSRMTSAGAITPGDASLETFTGVGYHFAAWLEIDVTATGATSWYGTFTPVQSGISGNIQG